MSSSPSLISSHPFLGSIFSSIGCDCSALTIRFLTVNERGRLISVSREFCRIFYAKTFNQDSLPENHRHLAEIFVQLMSVQGFTCTLVSIYNIAYRAAFYRTHHSDASLFKMKTNSIYQELMAEFRRDLVTRIVEGLPTKHLLSLNSHIKKNGNDLSPKRMDSTIQRCPSLVPNLQGLLNSQMKWSLDWYRQKKSIILIVDDEEERKESVEEKPKRGKGKRKQITPSRIPSQSPTSQLSQLPTQPLSLPEDEGSQYAFKKFKEIKGKKDEEKE